MSPEYREVDLNGPIQGQRPVWAGVAVMYEDGTVAAYQIDDPTDGRIELSNEFDDPYDWSPRRRYLGSEVEITVRGRSVVHWQQGADHATSRTPPVEPAERPAVER